MRSNSSLNPLHFELTLFADLGPLRYLFFSLSLLIYATIVSANALVVLTVCLHRSLHQPMYVFVCSLSLNSLYGSAGFFPRFLVDLLSDSHLISRSWCFLQIHVIYSYSACEPLILSVMAYDRYVAICQPLHYHSKMSFKTVRQLVLFAVLYPASAVGLCVYLTARLPLCGHKVHRLFCSVVQLSCVDTTVNRIAGSIFTATTTVLPLLFILYTYLRILLVCRRSSAELRGKALQTCLPHIVSFINYFLSIFFELMLSRFKYNEVDPIIIAVLSLEFLIIPPINDPLIYGLNLPQIRKVIFT
ncbi:olfactory receptor 6N1-like, partial [Plectropomus leopardus]|uniref:olfactory receptor 6N1-like n=1 Tax=Plectropomus leopardus TaxID=160734 RepID=UPI001C4AEAEA